VRLHWDRLRGAPLFGGLVDCDLEDHWKAVQQTVVVLVLSTMPVWLGTVIVYALGASGSRVAFWMAFLGTITKTRTELFMISTALLAPIFWMALKDPKGAREFPSKISHMILVTLINSIAAVFFGLTTAGENLNPRISFWISVVIFLASLGLLYLGTVYHEHRMPDAPDEFRRQEETYTEDLGEHHQ
jgi:hypothetical protein